MGKMYNILKYKQLTKFLTLLFVLCFNYSWGQTILGWDFSSGNNASTNLPGGAATIISSGITVATTGCSGNGYGGSAWNVGDYIQITAPTTGYSIGTLTFLVRCSNTGPASFKIQYSSTGTGGPYTDFSTFVCSNASSCNAQSVDLSGVSVLNCNANVVIRLVFTGGEADGSPATGDAATAGTFRMDDVSLTGIASCGSVSHTVNFYANGGTGSMSPQTATITTNLTSNTFTQTGCTFTGWNTAVDGSGTSYSDGQAYNFTADLTLYAQWNCGGGSGFSCTGAVGNGKTQGCGDSNPCNLSTIGAYLDGVACNTTLDASCTGSCDVQTPFSRLFIVPAGCTATVTAEMKLRNSGCGNSGMDSGDKLSITNSGGSVISQNATLSIGGTISGSTVNKNSGAGNADGWVQMIITGGVVTVGGSGQRGDEIVTYTVSFSGACSSCITILPITLLDFYGVQNNNTNELVWKVASEENIKRYVIEKSNDGINFEHMVGVYPNLGYTNKIYKTEDVNPYKGVTYYRLTTMENDYSVQYYKTISLEDNTSNIWKSIFYQQDNFLFLEFKNSIPKNSTISLFDLSGKLLADESITESQTKINTQNFSEGIYFLRISSPYKTENFKLIIQK